MTCSAILSAPFGKATGPRSVVVATSDEDESGCVRRDDEDSDVDEHPPMNVMFNVATAAVSERRR